MSVAAMLAVHKLAARTTHASYRVLMCLAEHADDSGGNAWPSIDSIAAEAQANEKTVRRSLAKLEAQGLIVGDHGRGRGNTTVWCLNFSIARLVKEGVPPALKPINKGILSGKEGIQSGKPGMGPPKPVLNLSKTTECLLQQPDQVSQPPPDRAAEMVSIWNTVCGDKLPKVQLHMQPDRLKALQTMLLTEMHGSIEGWTRFCQRVRAATYLTGENNRDWHASLDWCLKPANATKIIEGNFDRSTTSRQPGKSYAGCL